jgi:glycosyltransferase involved in cell wall biosynthesis
VRVLFLTQVLPYPPDSGAKLKTLNVLKSLGPEHDLTLVSFVRGDQRRDAEQLREYCRAVYTVEMRRTPWWDGRAIAASLCGGGPTLMLRDDRPEMGVLIDNLTTGEPFDLVHADQLNMCQYALRVPHAARVFDAHNALWLLCERLAAVLPLGLRRLAFNREARLLRAYEGRMCRAFDAVLAVSPEDRAALEAVGARRETITVLPITIDTQDIQPLTRQPADPPHLVYIGQMRWPPNVDAVQWFALAVLPQIRARYPDAVFQVIGADPPGSVQALADPSGGIEVLGYVDDPSAYLARAAALVVPLRAATGMRVKILEGMARGVPIVTTKLGCEGIAVEAGRHVLIADDPAEFATATLRLLDDAALAHRLAEDGRRLVETRYEWRRHRAALQAVYLDAVTRAERRPSGTRPA